VQEVMQSEGQSDAGKIIRQKKYDIAPIEKDLPNNGNGILGDEGVGRQYGQLVSERLASQHSIEGIAVRSGQAIQEKNGLFFQGGPNRG
jgi:hypothetical protein